MFYNCSNLPVIGRILGTINSRRVEVVISVEGEYIADPLS